jgi:hypothetical protein
MHTQNHLTGGEKTKVVIMKKMNMNGDTMKRRKKKGGGGGGGEKPKKKSLLKKESLKQKNCEEIPRVTHLTEFVNQSSYQGSPQHCVITQGALGRVGIGTCEISNKKQLRPAMITGGCVGGWVCVGVCE